MVALNGGCRMGNGYGVFAVGRSLGVTKSGKAVRTRNLGKSVHPCCDFVQKTPCAIESRERCCLVSDMLQVGYLRAPHRACGAVRALVRLRCGAGLGHCSGTPKGFTLWKPDKGFRP